ncbi:MAG TPA: 4'-phosphopantetheinyl transferase superfamily protein, partial [Syntrophales bacterium]|nr:4'-phosphopantetheinyl transferase superfamily protein [Syntrophales bacterium]
MRKSRNLRFINRVFTPSEQRQIFNSANPDTMIWAMWAGKETAYKIVSKCDPYASSTPRLYEVSLDCVGKPGRADKFSTSESSVSGSVDTPHGKIHIRIFVTRDYVHCVGATAPLEKT